MQRWFCVGGVALRHGRRTPVLKAYLKRAPNVWAHLPIDKEAPPAKFERCRTGFPCFV